MIRKTSIHQPLSSAPTARYHFEMKPEVPGVPMRPNPAIVKAAMVSGIFRPMPARSVRLTGQARKKIAPTARNSAAFISA